MPTKKTTTTVKKNDTNAHVGAKVATVATLAAAAAGAYWFYGAKDSQKHRKIAKSWMLKARVEVLDSIEKLKEIDKEIYLNIVQAVSSKYSKMGATPQELGVLLKDMQSVWSHIDKTHGPKKAVKSMKKAVQAVAKKSAKKATVRERFKTL